MARFARSLFPPLPPRAANSPAATSASGAAIAPNIAAPNTAAPSEPQWSRPLLLGLVSFFVLAQLFVEGMRFGLNVPGQSFSLAIMDVLRQPASGLGLLPHLSTADAANDALRMLARGQASPFWWMMARLGDVLRSNFLAFLTVHVLARWWATLAVFRLAERAFGHALTGILAAALWVGYGDVWPGGAALHHDYLAHSDVALALLLWTIALWSQKRATWGLLCGLAACADAPLGLALWAVLTLATWGTSPVAPSAARRSDSRAQRVFDEIARRIDLSWRATAWLALGAFPFWAQLLARRGEFASEGLAASLAWLARLNGPHAMIEGGVGAPWRLATLLAIGWFSWRRAKRQGASTRALGSVHAMLAALVVAGLLWPWLQIARGVGALQARPQVLPAIGTWLPRVAPLAVSLGLIGVANVLERAMARRGSGGLLAALLLVFGFISVSAPPPLWLVFGLCFIEAAQRADRAPDTAHADNSLADNPLAASLRRHGLWWITGAVALLALVCAMFPSLALRLTGSPITWATVGWMAASLLAWIATRAPRQANAQSTLFSSYASSGSLAPAALAQTSAAWNRARQAPSARHMSTHAARFASGRFASGRFALVAFVLAFGWRARGAAGWRLREGGGPMSRPQPLAWQAAQSWAKNHTSNNAVFLSTQSGWRAFSRRAVFADPNDGDLTSLSPDFARQWQWRSRLAAPLWDQSATREVFAPRDLRLLQARGLTHLVLPSDRLWPRRALWKPLLQPIYRNREWTIYRINTR